METNGHSDGKIWRKDRINNVLYHRALGIKYKNKSGIYIYI